MSPQDIAAELSAAFGPALCCLDDDVISAASSDPWHMHAGVAAAVMRPRTVEEVAAIVAWCHKHGVSVVPQGGNTGLAGGATPDSSGKQVVLSLSRLNKIREVDPVDYTITAEAGCVLEGVQEAAKQANRVFPLSFGAEGSCQIGGVLSTNAGGSNTLRYGNARDLVLGLEVVLADGTIWHGLRKLRKDNTGYDLRHLFMGAEGTLGIITAAVLKLFPAPKSRETVLATLSDLSSSVDLLALARDQLGETISAFELMPRRFVQLVNQHCPGQVMPPSAEQDWFVLLEIDAADEGSYLNQRVERFLEVALEKELICDAAIASNIEQRNKFWQLRENVAEAQLRNGAVIYTDVAVAVSRVPEFIETASARLRALDPQIDINAFGHVGDGNIHFNMLQPTGIEKGQFLSRKREYEAIIFSTVRDFNGSISAEHGIGQSKTAALAANKSTIEIDLMKTIRAALAKNVFNPNKVISLE